MTTSTIGAFAKNLILTTSLSNAEILEKIQEAFPVGKTSIACIAWYKSALRNSGQLAKRGMPEPTLGEKIAAPEAQIEALKANQPKVEEPKVEELAEE